MIRSADQLDAVLCGKLDLMAKLWGIITPGSIWAHEGLSRGCFRQRRVIALLTIMFP